LEQIDFAKLYLFGVADARGVGEGGPALSPTPGMFAETSRSEKLRKCVPFFKKVFFYPE
jgi:hypothetical protein